MLEEKSYYSWHSSFQVVLTYLTTAIHSKISPDRIKQTLRSSALTFTPLCVEILTINSPQIDEIRWILPTLKLLSLIQRFNNSSQTIAGEIF
ncbi:hypothetical protein NIES2109_45710 [Nostoc sp. HK-01]|nr:hypothetical protein NIES2109_45710 [Nostoc sp. HK-01]